MTSLKDGTEIPLAHGKKILQSFIKHESRPNIFDSFDYMDKREDYIRTTVATNGPVSSNNTYQKRYNNYGGGYGYKPNYNNYNKFN